MSDKELMQEALKWQEHIKVLANDHAEDELYQKRSKVFDWLIEQAEKTEIYKEALENIGALSFFSDGFSDKEKFVAALYHAKKALEGTE